MIVTREEVLERLRNACLGQRPESLVPVCVADVEHLLRHAEDASEEALEDASAEIEKLQEERDGLQAELDGLQAELDGLQAELDDAKAELQALRELHE